MQEKHIKIPQEESSAVEKLFLQFNAYCNILGYLSSYGSIEGERFDKKWAEAVEIESQLEQLKTKMDKKYHPDGDYHNFVFDFEECEMVYS